MSRLWHSLAGLVLVLSGLAGLALPILPGWALIFAGITVWARVFPWAKRLEVRGRTFLARHIPGALGELIAVKEEREAPDEATELQKSA